MVIGLRISEFPTVNYLTRVLYISKIRIDIYVRVEQKVVNNFDRYSLINKAKFKYTDISITQNALGYFLCKMVPSGKF